MLRLVLLAALAVASHKKHKVKPAVSAHAVVDLSAWEKTHPDAAQSLGDWVQANPTAAKAVFAWDARSTKTARNSAALVAWTLKQTGEAAEFMATHGDWVDFAGVVQTESLGVDRFIRWCRDHPKAAEELEAVIAPFAWLGAHAYEEQLKATPAVLP